MDERFSLQFENPNHIDHNPSRCIYSMSHPTGIINSMLSVRLETKVCVPNKVSSVHVQHLKSLQNGEGKKKERDVHCGAAQTNENDAWNPESPLRMTWNHTHHKILTRGTKVKLISCNGGQKMQSAKSAGPKAWGRERTRIDCD